MMKTFLIQLLVMVLTVTMISCNKKSPNDSLEVKDLSFGDCKTKVGITVKGDEEEYIILRTHDDYFILFSHINSIFNCLPGQITVSVINSNNTITIDENESKHGERCLCPYDIKCTMGPLQYGPYLIVFQKAGITYREYSLDFNESTNVKIDI